jgi:hypothetical protein
MPNSRSWPKKAKRETKQKKTRSSTQRRKAARRDSRIAALLVPSFGRNLQPNSIDCPNAASIFD